MTKEPWFDCRQEKEFSVLQTIESGSETHPASCTVGTWGSFSWLKWLRCEVDNPPLVQKLRMGGAILPIPIYVYDINGNDCTLITLLYCAYN